MRYVVTEGRYGVVDAPGGMAGRDERRLPLLSHLPASHQEPADLGKREEMRASPDNEDRHEERQQERPREVELRRGRHGESHEKEACSRRDQVAREGRHEREETHEEEAAEGEQVGLVVDVGGEIE